MYYSENIKDTDKNGTRTLKIVESLGLKNNGNVSELFSNGSQANEKNSTYSVSKNSITPNDIKALQHSLNVLEFTDRDGKRLEENGIWGSKTEYAWNTMQGKKQDSFENIPYDKYGLDLHNSNHKRKYSDVYKPDEYIKAVYDSNDDSDDSYYKTLSLLPKKSKNLLSDVWNETKWAFNTAGNYVNETQKAAQRKFWKTGADVYLRKIKKFETSAWLLEHSLQDNPSNVYRGNDSRIAYLMNQEDSYLNAVDNAIKNSNGTNFYVVLKGDDNTVEFNRGDLYYSIHGTTAVTLKGYKLNNGQWAVNAVIEDDYDYTRMATFMDDNGYALQGSLGTVANDAAVISQLTGAIKPFHITVNFWTVR